MRKNLLFISSLLWLFTFTSVAADTKQQQPVVSQQQSETIYGQLFAMQNRLGQLEAGLQQQQGHTEDLKDAEKELQQLRIELAQLELRLSSQKEVQNNELTAVSTRVSDAQANMSWWLGMAGLFLTLLTLMLAFVGFLTYQRSKDAALQQIQDFLQKEKPKLLEEAKTDILRDAEREIEVVRKQLTHDFTQKWEDFLEPLQKQAEQFFNTEKLNKDHPKNELSDEQKRQLVFATTLKPEEEFTAKDWYHRSTAQLANGDYSSAQQSIELALLDKSKLSRIELARFLFRQAICFSYLGDYQQEIATYNKVIDKFANDLDLKLQELVALSMYNKGVSLVNINQPQEALVIYNELNIKFSENVAPSIQEHVACSLYNMGFCLTLLNQFENAIAIYNDLVTKFGSNTTITLQKLLTNALLNKGVCLERLNQPKEALTIYDSVIARLADQPEIAQQELLVRALLNKGICYSLIEQPEKAMVIYDELISKFNDSTDPDIQQLVAKAMHNKGVRFGLLKQLDEAVEIFDDLLGNYNDSSDPRMHEVIAKTMYNKATCFAQLRLHEKAIAAYEDLIVRFGNSTEPVLQEQVGDAMTSQTEIALLSESAPQVLQRISACEAKIKDPQATAVMLFLRFILDNKSVDAVLDALKAMCEGAEISWKFEEIKPYLLKNLSHSKLHQCEAIIDFFEEHKDIKKLEAKLAEIS